MNFEIYLNVIHITIALKNNRVRKRGVFSSGWPLFDYTVEQGLFFGLIWYLLTSLSEYFLDPFYGSLEQKRHEQKIDQAFLSSKDSIEQILKSGLQEAKEFAVSLEVAAWVLIAPRFANVMFAPTLGKLSDLYGHARVWRGADDGCNSKSP